ncbi:MAG TPA: WbqC family protein [Candidatus Hydrogenedentes bacterium]|nr:WbqC family protein [Candidatus Hydrogenedentota bacterium]
MLVGIHQLHYLPWLRYFEKIARVDVFIALDNIQFTKNGWQNRNKIKTASGEALLTVPVYAQLGQTLDAILINDGVPWRKKHWRTIEQNYKKAPFFAQHCRFLEETYGQPWHRLNALNRHLLDYFLAALGIRTPVRLSSELDVPGTATERLVNLVRAVGGTRYYTGAFALDAYLDAELFAEAAIDIETQQWHSPEYGQLHGPYLPDLSILDLVLNCGPRSLDILLGTRPGPCD